MNSEYLWWFLALLLAAGGMVAFLALGRVPEIEDEPMESTGPGSTEPTAGGPEPTAGRVEQPQSAGGPESPQRAPESTTVPGPGAPTSTSETP